MVNIISEVDPNEGTYIALIKQALNINYPGDADKHVSELARVFDKLAPSHVSNLKQQATSGDIGYNAFCIIIGQLELPTPIRLAVEADV